MPTTRAVLAEFVGTFGGASLVDHATGSVTLVGVALAHGLILGVMVSATMHISGGQINPAVSIALAGIGKQPWSRAIVFVVAQCAGAVLAAFLLSVLLDSLPSGGQVGTSAVETARLGATLGSLDSFGAVFGLEVIATIFLMFVIMGTAVDDRGVGRTTAIGGFGIGLTVTADILCIGPLTGASMNPARSFGPALVGGHWDLHYVYWLAPIVGAMIAAVTYRLVFGRGESDERPA